MNQELKVIVLTEEQIKKLVYETMESIIEKRIPEIMRRANRKEIMTTKEVAELTGMSSRIQQYHRENKNLPYSQEGRKIFYRTSDIERFMTERRITAKE